MLTAFGRPGQDIQILVGGTLFGARQRTEEGQVGVPGKVIVAANFPGQQGIIEGTGLDLDAALADLSKMVGKPVKVFKGETDRPWGKAKKAKKMLH
jgi:hypothetical protein